MPRVSRTLAVVTAVLLAVGVIATRWHHFEPDPGHTAGWASQLLTTLAFGLVGVALGERVGTPSDRVAWVLQLCGLTQAAGLAAGSWARHSDWLGTGMARWLDGWVWAPGVLPVVTVLLFIFPTGRPLVGRWGFAVPGSLVVCALFTVAQAIAAWPGMNLGPVLAALGVVVVLTAIGGVASLVVRFRRENASGRAQIKWVALAVVVLLLFQPVQVVLPPAVATVGLATLPLLVPVTIGLAVARFRLYDVDLVISRTATYAVLTALLTVAYVAASAVLGVRSDGSVDRSAVVSALAVAVVAAPTRGVIQRYLDRWLLGDRSQHVAVGRLTNRLQQTIAAEDVPDAVVRTVIESLRVPYARLVVAAEDSPTLLTVEQGRTGPAVDLPVVYAGRRVGTLTVGRRTAFDTFSRSETRLLETLADAAAPAVDGLLLMADLREARKRTVLAREEERARLHRDLHDGLGPTLAGITLGLDAVRNLIEQRDTGHAVQNVDRLRALASGATSEVRTLVNGLRPPALDEKGLVEAVRQHADLTCAGLSVHVEADGQLDGLPDAVDVAALHIALEALTNVRRHARARNCWVRLATSSRGLMVEVDDDGVGPPPSPRSGVGTRSMRERAEELGGSVTWRMSGHGGMAVRATLPLAP